MIPKLVPNFLIDKDYSLNDLVYLSDKMRQTKIIYVEVILSGITNINELKPIVNAFKNMRNTKHIDFTIWLNAIDPDASLLIFEEISKTERLVMGITTSNDINIPILNWFNYSNNLSFPDIHTMMSYDDEATMHHNEKAINCIHAPEGMIRGLKRVLDDYARLGLGREKLASHEPKSTIVSDQELE